MYINDIESHFITENCPSVELKELNLFVLMFADDTVIFANSPDELQIMLNSLHTYVSSWNLTVNAAKTKVLVFRKGGSCKLSWTYNNEILQQVDSFHYLGLCLNYNGKFNVTQKKIADQGRKALFCLNPKIQHFEFNTETRCQLFDIYVESVISYGSEIWGFHKSPDLERLHLLFCKHVLGVRRNVCNYVIYSELGRCLLIIQRKLKIMKYWCKLLKVENCTLKSSYEYLRLDVEN